MKKTPIELANEAMQRLREAGELERLDPIQRAIRNPQSLSAAIKAMCYECVGQGSDQNARKEVACCTAFACPLWHLRPWQKLAPTGFGLEKRQAALAQYTSKYLSPVVADPTSRRKAITAQCVDCSSGYSAIAACKSDFPRDRKLNQPGSYFGCPLWPHRPLSKSTATVDVAEHESDEADDA